MGSKGSQTTTSSSAPPQAVMNAYQSALGMASQATSKPYQQYTGQLVAGLSPQQQEGMANISAAQGMALPAIQKGMDYTNEAAKGITPGLYNRFYSPYITDVANNTQRNLMESNAQQMSGLKGGAIQAGAFGGDRAGIAQAEMSRQQDLAMGQTMGNIYQQGYGQAMGLAGQQVQNLAQMGQQIAGLGAGAQSSVMEGGKADMAAGAQAQATQQAQLQAAYDQYQQSQAYPYQQAQFYGNIAEGIGAGAGGNSSTSTPGPSLASTIFGGLGALGSISDRRVKENIKPVGKLKDGQTVYSYNFKGHPQTQIGLIAQEVEKTHPEAVHEVNGLKTVNYETATRDAKASGGGLVLPEDARHGFAFGGIPYLTEDAQGRLGWIPKEQHNVSFNKRPNLPSPPPEYVDQPLDKSWGDLNPLSPAQVAGLKGLVGKVIPPTATTTTPATGVDANSLYASGGLVRGHFDVGGPVDATDPNAVITPTSGGVDPQVSAPLTAANVTNVKSPEKDSSYAKGLLPSLFTNGAGSPDAGTTQPHTRNMIERIMNTDLSPEARAGILSGSFALMGSRSPWFGQAVGDAGKVGMQTYYNALGQQKDLAKTAADIGEAGARTKLDMQQAELAKQSALKTHFDATGADVDNYYKAKNASGDPSHFMSLQDWVDQNGEHALANRIGSTHSNPPPNGNASGTPEIDPNIQGPRRPSPGNVLAPEAGPDENKPSTKPALDKQITTLTAKLAQETGSPYYDQDYKTLMALTDQRNKIMGSDEYKGMQTFRQTDPLMRQAIGSYMNLNAQYDGAAFAEKKSMLQSMAKQLGLERLLPSDMTNNKENYDKLLKAQADMIGVLADGATTTAGAPAASLGLEYSRIPGPDADPAARQAVATKLLALQDYNKDLYNTWDQGMSWANHQAQFALHHSFADYMRHADALTPKPTGSPAPIPQNQQKDISDLSGLFPNDPTGKVRKSKSGAVYVKTQSGWVPQ